MKNIRNFSIIAHIDHGKSTLADRMLEVTNTVSERDMQNQVLDTMELERERGITIKMQPVRMNHSKDGQDYILNLIDTPGHIDFRYEVSRALKAVEGSIMLVDATQGVQAQTLTTLAMAKEEGLVLIPVLTKIDSPLARVDDVSLELAELLDCDLEDIMYVSGKTGEGVEDLLNEVIKRVPQPKTTGEDNSLRGLVFDFEYSSHKGVILYVRVFDGEVIHHNDISFVAAGKSFRALEVGTFSPRPVETKIIKSGEIGYIVTGIKEAGVASVGDTIIKKHSKSKSLVGYAKPSPVVWASVYPEDQNDFDGLRLALGRLQLSDSSFSFEEETSGTLGRGYRCGFLGMLHLEIVTERLSREFNLPLVITTPSVTYRVVKRRGGDVMVYSPALFPDHGDIEEIYEPWARSEVMIPKEYLSPLMPFLFDHEAEIVDTSDFGDGRISVKFDLPLRELMRNFFDDMKSITSGYGSITYNQIGEKKADVVKMDILVAGDLVIAFSRIVSRARAQADAQKACEKLAKLLPRQMFVVKIQATVLGKIVASETLRAFKKNVTEKLYGGDITRKMKLREKQKKGKKKMTARGRVNIPQDIFVKMVRT